MTLLVEALELALLRLSTSERARLLDRVVASLDADKTRDKAWDKLAARRDVEIERGESSPVSGAKALARLRAELA
jgi:Putative addiction module component